MNCARAGCGHSESLHEDPPPGSPADAARGKCWACGCTSCIFAFRADEDGNVRPPSVEVSVERKRDDEPTKDFDLSDACDAVEKTKP